MTVTVTVDLEAVVMHSDGPGYYWIVTRREGGRPVESRRYAGQPGPATREALRRIRAEMLGWSDCG